MNLPTKETKWVKAGESFIRRYGWIFVFCLGVFLFITAYFLR